MQTLEEQKAAMRRQAGTARKQAHATASGAASALRDAVLSAAVIPPGAIVSGYCPMRSEIDPIPLMTALQGAGHRLAMPVIAGPASPLKFREWSPGCAMEEGPFGASVPAEGNWLEPGVLLVPMLAYDAGGYRLGYGGGFYDRTLEALRARRPTVAIGIAYAAQRVDAVPRDAYDQRLDLIVTEAGIVAGTDARMGEPG